VIVRDLIATVATLAFVSAVVMVSVRLLVGWERRHGSGQPPDTGPWHE
jgi:hypothetical protein